MSPGASAALYKRVYVRLTRLADPNCGILPTYVRNGKDGQESLIFRRERRIVRPQKNDDQPVAKRDIHEQYG